jgi:hypothetical protein
LEFKRTACAGAGFEGRLERAELDGPFAEFWAPHVHAPQHPLLGAFVGWLGPAGIVVPGEG